MSKFAIIAVIGTQEKCDENTVEILEEVFKEAAKEHNLELDVQIYEIPSEWALSAILPSSLQPTKPI